MKVKILIFAIMAILVVGYIFGKRFLFQMEWELVSQAKSSNGEFIVKHFKSKSEGGHAPYGDNLVIESWKSFPYPKQGETFFAGYCGNTMQYKWEGNERILITCHSRGEPFRTVAVVVHGIEVEVADK